MIIYNVNRADWNSEDAVRYMMTMMIFPARIKQLICAVSSCYPASTLSRIASALNSDIRQAQCRFRNKLAVMWDMPVQVFTDAENIYFSFDDALLSACIGERIDLWKLAFRLSYFQFCSVPDDGSVHFTIRNNKQLFLIVSEQDRVDVGQDLNDYMSDFKAWIDGYLQKTDPDIEKLYIRFDTLITLLMHKSI